MSHYFHTVFVVYLIANLITSAPIKDASTDDTDVELHDQRQNGTENYRVEMKDVLIVFSPMEALISAAALATDPAIGLFKPPLENDSSALFPDLKLIDEQDQDPPVVQKQNRKWWVQTNYNPHFL